MPKPKLSIVPYTADRLDAILALSVKAWDPVFPQLERAIPDYVFAAFYPHGWQARQLADISAICNDDGTSVWLALVEGDVAGYIGVRVHQEDSMGEIHVVAVDPDFQRQGIGSELISFALDWCRRQGLAMMMVETGEDEGHAAARSTYEQCGFDHYPVARYFRKL